METKKEFKPLFPVTYGIPEQKTGLIMYHICSDGVYMSKKVMGTCYATVKVDGIAEKGMPKGEEKLSLMKRKIPMSFFWEITQFFRYVETYFGERALEAYVLIGYNPKEDKYILYVPEHTVTAGSVRYDIEKFWSDNPGYYVVCDVHSHNHMSAFFSSTDDKDDNRDRFSMVIGHIGHLIPSYKIRFSLGTKRMDMELDDLFEENDEEFKIDREEDIKRIKLHDYKAARPADMTAGVTIYQSRGYTPQAGKSLYDMIKNKMQKKEEFTIEELMGDNW